MAGWPGASRRGRHHSLLVSSQMNIPAPCSVAGCDNPVRSSGAPHCEMHYYRLRRTGTLSARPWHRRGECSTPDCHEPEVRWGLCSMHAMRMKRHGDPSVVIHPKNRDLPREERNHRWTGDDATYTAIHQRVRYRRGPASRQLCTDCGRQARHWSYDHADPDGRVSDEGLPYSLDVAHYVPRCVSCHKQHDLARHAQEIS